MPSSAESADRRSSSAPGKILLAGEYVVLDGAPAVVMAVDRRARARLAAGPQALSPFLAAVRDLAPDPALAARVVVDSSALATTGGTKLGLGSSAAACVCAAACALGSDDPDRVHALAHRAHAAAQAPRGARGSGADVAAAVHGGVLIVQRDGDGDGEPLAVRRARLPPGLALLPVWTGAAAATAPLVAQVRALRARDPAAYARAADRVADAAADLAATLTADGDPAATVEAVRAGGAAVAALGAAAGCPLWTAAHDRARAAVEPLGAAVKPTGAGGGDLALIACADAARADAARAALAAAGMIPLDLRVDPTGVRLHVDPPERVG